MSSHSTVSNTITPRDGTGSLLVRAARLRALAESLEERAALAGHVGHIAASGGWLAVLHGDWSRLRHAAEGAIIQDDRGQMPASSSDFARSTLALVGALRGEPAVARRWAATAARPDACGAAAAGAELARALAWADVGDRSAAFETLRSLVSRARRSYPGWRAGEASGLLATFAVTSVQRRDATCLLQNLRATAGEGLTTREPEELDFAEIMLSDTDRRERGLRALLARRRGGSSFGEMRAGLAMGMLLRRTYRPAEARPYLEAAHDAASLIGAQRWKTEAAFELRAAGVPDDGEGLRLPLSVQEIRIARLAADGKTNAQIGEELHLSPRTVGSHLYRVFPKLGISSRAQLARRLDQAS